jgi:hypothetical protein
MLKLSLRRRPGVFRFEKIPGTRFQRTQAGLKQDKSSPIDGLSRQNVDGLQNGEGQLNSKGLLDSREKPNGGVGSESTPEAVAAIGGSTSRSKSKHEILCKRG